MGKAGLAVCISNPKAKEEDKGVFLGKLAPLNQREILLQKWEGLIEDTLQRSLASVAHTHLNAHTCLHSPLHILTYFICNFPSHCPIFSIHLRAKLLVRFDWILLYLSIFLPHFFFKTTKVSDVVHLNRIQYHNISAFLVLPLLGMADRIGHSCPLYNPSRGSNSVLASP